MFSARHKLIIFISVLILTLLVSIRPGFRSAQYADTTPKKRLIDQAHQAFTNLRAQAKNSHSEQDYLAVLAIYKQAYDDETGCHCGDEALLAMGKITEEMAGQFQKSRYHYNAVDYYQQLINGYADSPHRAVALLSMARVYERHLTDRQAAALAYGEVVRLYPNSVSAREASANIVRLSGEPENGEEIEQPTKPLAQLITSIRNFVGPDYARVVIDLSAPIEFEKSANSTNGNIGVIVRGAKIDPTLASDSLTIPASGLLKEIQAESTNEDVKLKLACAKLKDYAIFTLNNPYRLVIDMRGQNSQNNTGNQNNQNNQNGETIAQNQDLTLQKIQQLSAQRPSFLRVLGLKVKRIVIDAGHGGHDSGALGSAGLVEKELVLNVAQRLKALIKQQLPDIDVVMTRDKDQFVALEERTAIANAQAADLFISIHANSSQNPEASGVETYFLSINASKDELEVAARENASTTRNARDLQTLLQQIVLDDKVIESRDFAQQLQRSLVTGLGRADNAAAVNRGVRNAPFIVLIGANMPSVLAEIAFVSNPQQAQLLKTSEFRQQIAESLLEGVKRYVNTLAKGSPTVAAKSTDKGENN